MDRERDREGYRGRAREIDREEGKWRRVSLVLPDSGSVVSVGFAVNFSLVYFVAPKTIPSTETD